MSRNLPAIALTCRGCGQVLQVGPADTRLEIECLWCGAKSPLPGRDSPVPKAAAAKSASVSTSAIAAGPPPSAVATAVTSAPPVAAKPKEEPAWFEQTPYGVKGMVGESAAPSPYEVKPGPPPASPPPPRPVLSDEEGDDGSPYGVGEKLNYRCEDCGRVLQGETVLCPSCGYNHETGVKAEREYEPLTRSWEAGWPLHKRIRILIFTQAMVFGVTILGLLQTGSFTLTFPAWLMAALMTAFILGTYDRVDLSRNRKGKIVLQHTWRFFFAARPTKTLRLGQFEGVTKGKWYEPDFWDWMIFIFFVPGVITGILWWYFILHRDMFYVALTKDHGHPEMTLYRGWSEEHMRDLYETIRTVVFPVEIKR